MVMVIHHLTHRPRRVLYHNLVSHHSQHQTRRLAHDRDQRDRQRAHTRRKPVHTRYTHGLRKRVERKRDVHCRDVCGEQPGRRRGMHNAWLRLAAEMGLRLRVRDSVQVLGCEQRA